MSQETFSPRRDEPEKTVPLADAAGDFQTSRMQYLEQKTMWKLSPPPGFQGLRDDVPLTHNHQLLPHFRQNGATYFVTLRLQDSLPDARSRELVSLKQEWERNHPEPRDKQSWDELARDVMRRVDPWLDQGLGSCHLKSPEISQLVADALHRSDGSRCELGSYVVMPNHVHIILRPLAPETDTLDMILKHWKGSSSRSMNEKLKNSGMLWHREGFEHLIRDAEQLWRILQYIGANPGKAGLLAGACQSWISPAWIERGWKFETA
jgi:REP element-mobilizing transposase RayT